MCISWWLGLRSREALAPDSLFLWSLLRMLVRIQTPAAPAVSHSDHTESEIIKRVSFFFIHLHVDRRDLVILQPKTGMNRLNDTVYVPNKIV